MLDPLRAERLWLAIALATLWMVIKGGEAENQSPPPKTLSDFPLVTEFFLYLGISILHVIFLALCWDY